MLKQVVIGAAMVALTVVIHAAFMEAALGHAAKYVTPSMPKNRRALVIVVVVLWLFLSIVLQAWLWCGLFLVLDVLPDMESALYFSTVTYTSLGFGDLTLEYDWRLLSAFEAANGTIIIGWTTALVFAAVQRVYGFNSK